MSAKTYKLEALVLKKTKLRESDLIVDLLGLDGSKFSAVAHGARKPGSVFSSRLELFSHVALLMYEGKNLDTIKEVSLLEPFARLRNDYLISQCACVCAELMEKICLKDLSEAQFFHCTRTAFGALSCSSQSFAIAICAAHMLKIASFAGFRPMFSNCIECGEPLFVHLQMLDELNAPKVGDETLFFDFHEGGSLCKNCAQSYVATSTVQSLLAYCHHLLYSTFEQISCEHASKTLQKSALALAGRWAREQIGIQLKSLPILQRSIS